MKVGVGTKIHPLTNIYCDSIGNNCTVANFVEIGKKVVIGDYCSIQGFAYIPEGVTLGDNVFVGPHVCFTNCKHPHANEDYIMTCESSHVAYLQATTSPKFKLERTVVEDNVVIGAGAIIMCGVTLGKGSTVGAGSLVLKDVPENCTVMGEWK